MFSVFALGDDGTPAETPTFSAGASDEVSTIVPAGRRRVAADDSNGHHGQVDIELGAGDGRILELRLERYCAFERSASGTITDRTLPLQETQRSTSKNTESRKPCRLICLNPDKSFTLATIGAYPDALLEG